MDPSIIMHECSSFRVGDGAGGVVFVAFFGGVDSRCLFCVCLASNIQENSDLDDEKT